MVLRCPRFAADPVLEACLDGSHRMTAPEQGLAVKRVQAALLALGRSVGPAGADGIFGPDTGAAVSAYKAFKGLHPTDPVVGKGTMGALDDDLFIDPPTLDPAFKEFAPAVVDHLLEPFVGQELADLLDTPLNSWRHMLGRSALDTLNSRELLGIAARSRSADLRQAFLDAAAPVQPGGTTAEALFDGTAPGLTDGSAVTVDFEAQDGSTRAFILIGDDVVLGRATIRRASTGRRAPNTLQGTLVHELSHVRNRDIGQTLRQTPDTDTGTYVDTALAQTRTAIGGAPTVEMMVTFAEEITTRHVEWIVLQESRGNPTAALFLPPEQLAEAARFYFSDTGLFDFNGYVPEIVQRGDSPTMEQIGLWLRRCQELRFSDDQAEDDRTTVLFGDAAAVCADQAANPPATRVDPDGLTPLPADFVLG